MTAGSSVNKAGFALPMDESVGVELSHMKSVEAALPVRFHYFTYHNQFVYLIATDVHAFDKSTANHGLGARPQPFPAGRTRRSLNNLAPWRRTTSPRCITSTSAITSPFPADGRRPSI